jgi:DNA-binding CsgD family transcriptional regulator
LLKGVTRGWEPKLEQAVARGYGGMRVNGNVAWLKKRDWRRFQECEKALDESLALKPMIALCSYALERCGCAEVLDVARTHQFAIAKRAGDWEVVEWRPLLTSPDRFGTLTAREREVFRLAAEGFTSSQIAAQLSISDRTVESHRASLMRKLGLRNQTTLVRYAIQRGTLAPRSGNARYLRTRPNCQREARSQTGRSPRRRSSLGYAFSAERETAHSPGETRSVLRL